MKLKYKQGDRLWLNDPKGRSTGECIVLRFQDDENYPYVVKPLAKGAAPLYGAPECRLSPLTKLGKYLAGVEDV